MEQRGGFMGMLLGTLRATVLGNFTHQTKCGP